MHNRWIIINEIINSVNRIIYALPTHGWCWSLSKATWGTRHEDTVYRMGYTPKLQMFGLGKESPHMRRWSNNPTPCPGIVREQKKGSV